MKTKNPITIRGKVIGADGKPWRRVAVQALRKGEQSLDELVAFGWTGPKGEFQLLWKGERGSALKAAGRESGPDLVLVVTDAERKELWRTEPRSGKNRYTFWRVEVGAEKTTAKRSGFGAVLIHPKKDSELMETLGVTSVRELRTLDEERLVEVENGHDKKIDRTRVRAIKARANLAAVTKDDALLQALTSAGIGSLRQLAFTSPKDLEEDLQEAIAEGKLTKGSVRKVSEEAGSLYGELAQVHARLAPGFDDPCEIPEEGCCDRGLRFSAFSKRAYLYYLIGETGVDPDMLTAVLFQDFANADCEQVPVVRLGIEVLSRQAIRSSATEEVRREYFQLFITDLMLVRQGLLSLADRVPTEKRDEFEDLFGTNPIQGANLDDLAQLQTSYDDLGTRVRGLHGWLGTAGNTNLGRDLIDSAWLRTSTDEYQRCADELPDSDFWRRQLADQGMPDNDGFAIVERAILLRDLLIRRTGKSASGLRGALHMDFSSTEGRRERCEQAILTLQEMLRCREPGYLVCCPDDGTATEIIQTRFRGYEQFRGWLEQNLYPENFYDLHWKVPLVRGDLAALREELAKAEDTLEMVTARSEGMESVMGLFRLGLQTVRGLLDLDDKIARAHLAYRDEEYGIAIDLYRQAAEKIRAHVRRFHDGELASYEQLFANDRSAGLIQGCDGNRYIAAAPALLEALEQAQLCQAFRSDLLNPDLFGEVAEASNWWPTPDLIPTADEIQELLDWAMDEPVEFVLTQGFLGPVATAKLVRNESGLAPLSEALALAPPAGPGWVAFDVPDASRLSLPFILRDGWLHSQDQVMDGLEDAAEELVMTIAGDVIGRTLQALRGDVADLQALRQRLEGIWGSEPIQVDLEGLGLTIENRAVPLLDIFQETLDAIAQFFGDIANAFGLDLLSDIVTNCTRLKLPPEADPGCVVDRIVGWVEGRVEALPEAFGTIEELRQQLQALSEDALDQVGEDIGAWVTNLLEGAGEQLETVEQEYRAAFATFATRVIELVSDDLLIEDRSVWIHRDGSLQERSNIHNIDDVRAGGDRRRGTILYHTPEDGTRDFDHFRARTVLRAVDNDDLGVAFRFRLENGGASYYLVSLRSGEGEAEEHELTKRTMQIGWTSLISGIYLTVSTAETIPTAGTGYFWVLLRNLPPAFFVWAAGLAVTEWAWDDVIPRDDSGSFFRLLKVTQEAPNQPPRVDRLDARAVGIELDRDYEPQILVREGDAAGSLKIEAGLSDPNDPDGTLPTLEAIDHSPLGPGRIGLYAFANSLAEFKTLEITQYPCASTLT